MSVDDLLECPPNIPLAVKNKVLVYIAWKEMARESSQRMVS